MFKALTWNMAWSDPPTNSGIMDFNCNFPAKIAQQPRDLKTTNNLRGPIFSIQIFLMLNRSMKSLWWQPTWNQIKSIQLELAEMLLDKIPFGPREWQQCRGEFAKVQILLRDKFCSVTSFAKGQILLRDKFC